MVIRTCPNCDKSFKMKCDYDYHTDPNRKFACIAPKIIAPPIPPESPPTSTEFTPNKLSCRYCNKIFSRSDSLKRHENDRCKQRTQTGGSFASTEVGELKQIIMDQQKKMEELEKKIESNTSIVKNQTINNGTVNNGLVNNGLVNNGLVNNGTVNNNITISFGNESLKDYMDKPELLIEALKKCSKRVSKMIELYHCNEELPQFLNMYVPHQKNTSMCIYNKNGKWKTVNKKECLAELYRTKDKILDEAYGIDEIKQKFNQKDIKKIDTHNYRRESKILNAVYENKDIKNIENVLYDIKDTVIEKKKEMVAKNRLTKPKDTKIVC
jgi:hypothetical protein